MTRSRQAHPAAPDLLATPAASAGPPHPWHLEVWARLWRAHTEGALGHALLVSGPAGIGKRMLTETLARALLCRRPTAAGYPCGECAECRLTAAGNHPDLLLLRPDAEAKSPEIKAEQVRALCERQTLTPHRAARKVIRIVPAEAMNPFAANSLLKTLEEPVDSTLLILVAEQVHRLPATVRSRCQQVRLTRPPAALALPWLQQQLQAIQPPVAVEAALLLQLAHGAPLLALGLADADHLTQRTRALADFIAVGQGRQDPLAVADAWQRLEPALVLGQLAGWVSDLLRLAVDPACIHLDNPDQRTVLSDLLAYRASSRAAGRAAGLDPATAQRFLQQILAARAQAAAPINKQLMFESLLVQWARIAPGGAHHG